ncbi:MAG TPA: type IV pilus modification protein PilV [Xanthomonadaceae bacterium]|nr:type IV pilus modification protein PilV [Xanthomonadaceae bacterium]
MSSIFSFRTRRGFSLIEVLVAVVILSVGLLALAALQINIVRSSADAKSRSTALSLAQEKLEQAREFRSRGSDQINCPATTAATWPERYSCVGPSPAPETMTVGGTTFSRTWTVGRYVFDSVNGSFASTGVGTADTALATGLRAGTEFKRVDVTVAWTDAEGDNRLVTVTDSVSASSPSESSRARAVQRAGVRSPEVLITDPSGTPGVIPIAIGNGTDTAATNPRPEVAGRNNNQRVIETRFDVLTYSGVTGTNNAQVQSRVETVVVGCTCSDTPGSPPAYRPTYWTGNRYAAPEKVTSTPPAQHASLGNNAPPESKYCTECCRDHHDAGFSGPKFSPWAGYSHAHQIVGGVYKEACRLIRVDGIFRVAADSRNDYFNLLETANSSSDPVPSGTASTNYQDMVLGYLNSRIVTPSTGYNTPPSASTVSALETAHSINSPSQIQIARSGATKWLHARGLYFDFLESDAIQAIADAKSNCDTSSTTMQACVLSHVPFTSINLTELANWSPRSGQEIVVENNDFIGSVNSTDPVRGKTVSINATPGSDQTASSEIFDSSSGLALLPSAVTTDETTRSDSQVFHITGTGGPPPGSQVFQVSLNGYAFAGSTGALPTITSTNTVCNPNTSASPNPYACSSSSLGVAKTLVIGQYNYQDSSRTSNTSITCTGPFASKSYTGPYPVNYCRNYAVTSASGPGGTGVISSPSPSDGVVGETTAVSFPLVSSSDALSIGLTFQGETTTALTCTYTCTDTNNGNTDCRNAQKTVFTVSAAPCP